MSCSHSRLTCLLLTAKYTKEKVVDDPEGPNAINTCVHTN